jgi:hypothetical protein
MSKRKAKAGKRARKPVITTRAHGSRQSVVRSAKGDLTRSDATQAPEIERQETFVAEKRVQEDPGQNFASAIGSVVGCQAQLLEIAQANTRLNIEFGRRLATIRSPFELVDVIAGFTKRRADMLVKNAEAMAALTRR